MSDYQVLREKAASQRRDVERALTRFMAKTGETQSLFKDDVTTFPRESGCMERVAFMFPHRSLKCVCVCVWTVIAARPSSIPYLSALLPSELELQSLEETDSSEQDDQTDSENAAGNMITVRLGAAEPWFSFYHYSFLYSTSLSSRMILELKKRTPCCLPVGSFPPPRPARTA